MLTRSSIVFLATVAVAAAGVYIYLQSRRQDSGLSDDPDNSETGGDADEAAQPSLGTDPFNYIGNAFVSTSPQLGLGINNPGNLRYIGPPHNWNGEIANVRGFGQYATMELGARAMGHQLMKYYNAGNTTVETIVGIYAPSTENDTSGYTNNVAAELGVLPTDPLPLPGRIGALMYAMIFREQGSRPIDPETLQSWGTEL